MASNLIVLAFDGVSTARTVWAGLGPLEEEGVLEVEDAVLAWREEPQEGISGASSMAAAGVTTASSVGTHTSENSVFDSQVQIEQTRRPKTGKFAGRGAAIGFVAGLLLGGPLGGLAVGAGVGALTGAMKDAGIKDDFVKKTAAALRPGTSAIFFLGHANDQERVLQELKGYNPRILSTSLEPETEARLRSGLKNY